MLDASIKPLNVCVYGSSSGRTPQRYLDEARRLGNLLAEGDHLCINGAGKQGCMGALNDGVQESGGRVRGVIHAKFVIDNEEHPYVVDLTVVEGNDLQARKKALVNGVDAIIALPGGPGTWDELWEMACQRGVGFTRVPIVAINVDSFYDGFVTILDRAYRDGLLYLPPTDLIHFEPNAEQALQWCVEHRLRPDDASAQLPVQQIARSAPSQQESQDTLEKLGYDVSQLLESSSPKRSAVKPALIGAVAFVAGCVLTSWLSGSDTTRTRLRL